MPDEVIAATQAEQAPAETQPESTEVESEGGAESQAVETDEQKNERVQREARERTERRQRGVQKRIDELTADKYAERAARERVERELAELKAAMSTKSQPGNGDGEPQRDQYSSYEDYLRALGRFEARQAALQAAKEDRERTEKSSREKETADRIQREAAEFKARQAKFIETTPDYMATVQEAQYELEAMPASVVELLRVLPEGPQVIYAMAKNPSLAEQFTDSNSHLHGFLMGQLVASLKGSAAAPKPTTKAPPPGTPVKARTSGGSSDSPPSNPDEYQAWAAKNMR